MDDKENVRKDAGCECRRNCQWPMIFIGIVVLFALGFGLRICSIADQPEKLVEETSYKATSNFPG